MLYFYTREDNLTRCNNYSNLYHLLFENNRTSVKAHLSVEEKETEESCFSLDFYMIEKN